MHTLREQILSHLTMRHLITLTLGIILGIGGALIGYSAVAPEQITRLVTMAEEQCQRDPVCMTEVANGLERAATTLREVAISLRSKLSNTAKSSEQANSSGVPPSSSLVPGETPSTSTSPVTSSSLGESSGGSPCYFRTTDNTRLDDAYEDNIGTYSITDRGVEGGLYLSSMNCEPIELTCRDSRIALQSASGKPIDQSLVSRSIGRKGSTSIPVSVPEYEQYLGYSQVKCKASIPVVNTPGTTTLVEGTSTTQAPSVPGTSPAQTRLYPDQSPAKEVVVDLPKWNYSGGGWQCPLQYPEDGYYSSYYQCRQVIVKCNSNNVIETNLGSIRDVVTDSNSRGVYNSVSYPQYLGKSYDDCKIAIDHANTLERARLYR